VSGCYDSLATETERKEFSGAGLLARYARCLRLERQLSRAPNGIKIDGDVDGLLTRVPFTPSPLGDLKNVNKSFAEVLRKVYVWVDVGSLVFAAGSPPTRRQLQVHGHDSIRARQRLRRGAGGAIAKHTLHVSQHAAMHHLHAVNKHRIRHVDKRPHALHSHHTQSTPITAELKQGSGDAAEVESLFQRICALQTDLYTFIDDRQHT